jgi:hypothetical protein
MRRLPEGSLTERFIQFIAYGKATRTTNRPAISHTAKDRPGEFGELKFLA